MSDDLSSAYCDKTSPPPLGWRDRLLCYATGVALLVVMLPLCLAVIVVEAVTGRKAR